MTTDRRTILAGGAVAAVGLTSASPLGAAAEPGRLAVPANEFAFRATVGIGAPIELGRVDGVRKRVIPIIGGNFAGPALRGTVLPGGADWQALRDDGTADILARYTLRTDDGTIISVVNPGYRYGPPEILAHLAQGANVDPASYYFRTTPRFDVAEESRHAWLGRNVFIATAARFATRVVLDVYKVG